ncbi:MAG TPA: hypothetical protein PKA13_15385 [Geminicoccaceae bacterium]|nr:hypothetical protein [Geminicoccaceae bacterium]
MFLTVKISDLQAASATIGDEEIPVVQGGITRRGTVAALLANGTVPGRLAVQQSPQAGDDVVRKADLDGVAALGPYDVRRFGAVWDGASHRLDTVYPSLAAARAVYPFATDLGQEIDFCATQAAIDAAAAAGGGTVVLPAGTGIFDDTLVFPESRPFGDPGTQVNMRGEGWRATRLKWNADLGAGRFAVACGDPAGIRSNGLGRHADSAMYEGYFEDFCLEGPNPPGQLATAHTAMSGLAWGARRILRRVTSRQFYAGIDLVGDHTLWDSVYTPDNYYGLYYSAPSTALYGDMVFVKCMFTGCRMAAIAVHPRAYLSSAVFIGCYIGGAPYGIMKEAVAGAPETDDRLMAGVVFDRCMFEYIGNAMLEDRNFGDSATAASSKLTDVQFRGMSYFQWRDGFRITGDAAHPRRAIWNVAVLERVSIQGWGATFSFVPGDVALFRVGQVENAEFDLRWSEVFANCATAGKPVFDDAVIDPWAGNRMRWREGGLMGGIFTRSYVDSQGIFEKDDFVQKVEAYAVKSGSSHLPLGVAQMASTSPRTWIGIATWGRQVRCRVSGTIANNKYVKSGTGGAAAIASGPNDGHRIGSVFASQSGYAILDMAVS